MSGHVKVLACILLLEVIMSSLLIRYFNNRMSRKFFYDEQELMKTNIKVLKVCHRTVVWMTLKLNTHDMIMVSFCKACIDFPR